MLAIGIPLQEEVVDGEEQFGEVCCILLEESVGDVANELYLLFPEVFT